MEQHIQNSRFLVLTGHLNDYPLSDLVGILRHQHKTGRLLIEYPNGPASFYFNDGELVDAQLGKLNGLQALCVASAQPASSFNFNPLVRPTRRSIENSLQKAVSELLGCWSENDCEIHELAPAPAARMALPSVSSSTVEASGTRPDALAMAALAAPTPEKLFSHPFVAMGAAGLLLLGLSTMIAVTGGFGKNISFGTVPNSAATASDKVSIPSGREMSSSGAVETETRSEPKIGRHTGKGRDIARAPELSNRQASNKNETSSPSDSTSSPLTPKPAQEPQAAHSSEATSDSQSVKVLLQIEGGRVAKASIANPRSGMEAYEAMALRIARQRRFPGNASQETVTIKVSQPK